MYCQMWDTYVPAVVAIIIISNLRIINTGLRFKSTPRNQILFCTIGAQDERQFCLINTVFKSVRVTPATDACRMLIVPRSGFIAPFLQQLLRTRTLFLRGMSSKIP
jgi:hypothetical protein